MLRLVPRNFCREGFKKLDILTIPCLYIYALMLFAVKNLNTQWRKKNAFFFQIIVTF